MKHLVSLILPLIVLFSCGKGDNYCNTPKELKGFVSDVTLHNPYLPVEVQLDYIDLYGNSDDQIFFSFSVPVVFERVKGADRPTDVTRQGFYSYQLLDPENPPYSVDVEAYVFNDCGKSEIAHTTIYFDTVQ